MTNAPVVVELRKKSRVLAVEFDDGARAAIDFDVLRARSPSAENKAEPAQTSGVDIVSLQPVGNYALRPVFSDGHQSGIYSWQLLRELCEEQK